MLYSLQGTLEWQGVGFVIIEVGGMGFKVFVPSSSALGKSGDRVKLYTHLYVKEDSLALYGFPSAEELELFQMLLGTSGVGPKVALSLLSALMPRQLASAIVSEDVGTLSQVPGVGHKMAARLVLELKGKMEQAGFGARPPIDAEVMAALRNLGYSSAEATSALTSIPQSPELTPEDKLRLALRNLAQG